MFRKTLIASAILCAAAPGAFAASKHAPSHLPVLTASQIIAKNVKARGGLAKWRAVKTLSLSGMMEAGGKDNTQLPFVMRMKRPRKMEFELTFGGQTAKQAYDGKTGWKLRPFLNRTEAEPYTPEEIKKASEVQDLDGPLIDYAAKGTKVALEGIEPVEGREAYKLRLTLRDQQARSLWIDRRSFLEVKIEGSPRVLDGREHKVATYFRDYRLVDGLQMPFVYETVVDGVQATHKMTIDKVVVNPAMDDALFSKPAAVVNASLAAQGGAAAAKAGPSRIPDSPAPDAPSRR